MWLFTADYTFLKPDIENYVRELLAREFAIRGAFELKFSDRVTLIAEDVTLGNSDWAEADEMLHVEHLRLEVNLWSLLDGPVIINRLEVSGARVFLQQLADSRRNWIFNEEDSVDEGEIELFVLEELSLEDLTITYTAPQFAKPVSIRNLSVRQIHRAQDDHRESEIAATINGREIEVHLDIGPFENLVRGEAFSYEVTALLAGLNVSSSGYIDDLASPARPGLTLRLESPDIDELTNLLGLGDYGDGALSLDLQLVPLTDSVELSIQGDLAGLRIDASGTASELRSLRQATFRIEAEGSSRFLTAFGLGPFPDEYFRISGRVSRDAASLTIEDLTMELGKSTLRLDGHVSRFPDLDAADLQLSVQGEDLAQFREILQLPAAATGPFEFNGSIKQTDNGSDVVDILINTPQLSLRLSGPLGDPPAYADTRFTFTGAGSDLRALFTTYGIVDAGNAEIIPVESFEINGEIAITNDAFQLARVRAKVGDAQVQIDGHLSRETDFIGSRLLFVASGTDLEDLLADAANIDVQPTEFKLSGSIERLVDSLRISDVRLAGVAQSQLQLDVDIGWPMKPSSFGEFRLQASAADASKLPLHHPAFEFSALPLEVEARGNWRDGRLIFEEVSAQLGQSQLTWQGVFDRLPDLSATDLRLSIDAPDLSVLGLLNGEPLPAYPFLLNAHFDGTIQSYVLDEMSGVLGRTQFSGRLEVDFKGPRPYVDAQLDFSVLDLRDWLGDDKAPEQVLDDQRVIPNYPLPLASLGVIDGTLIVTAREVHMESILFTNALLRAELADGALRVPQLELSAPLGRFDGTLTVLPVELEADVADVHFTLVGEDVQLNLTGESAEDLARTPTYDLNIDIAGRGNTTRELAETLNGHVGLQSEGGRIRNQAFNILFGEFSLELIARLNPFSNKDPYSEITCVVVAFDVTQGVFETSPNIVIQSSKINLVSNGTIDLAEENISFNFNTRPRRRLSISAVELINPYIRVSGTLNNPRISLDPRGTAITGGAAAVTGGLSILAQAAWERTFREKNPCEAALAANAQQ